MSHWYFSKGDRRYGPLGESQLRQFVADGRLALTDDIWTREKAGWRRAGCVADFLPDAAIFADGEAPETGAEAGGDDSGAPAGVVSMSAGIAAMLMGTAAISLIFTEYAGLSMPVAMAALIVGNIGLVIDWFGDVARYSISVMGVVTGTLAICVAFALQGGLSFERYAPIVITKEASPGTTREVKPNGSVSAELSVRGPDEISYRVAVEDSRTAFGGTPPLSKGTPASVPQMASTMRRLMAQASQPSIPAIGPQIIAAETIEATHVTSEEACLYLYKVSEFFTMNTPELDRFSGSIIHQAFGEPLAGKEETRNVVLSERTPVKVLKSDRGNSTLCAYVRVVGGPHKGMEGWIADKCLIGD